MTPSKSVMMAITAEQMMPYTKQPVTGTWVAEGMSDVLDKWKSIDYKYSRMFGIPPAPILIKAPTGTGKTTFITEKLTEVAKLNGKCVLMLVNRTALVRQIINDTCKLSLGYSFSSDSMDGINRVSNLIVLTYQQFGGDYNTVLSNLMLPQNIQYVVMDEAHFFASDAWFNYQTPNILRNILNYSYDKQRIYMSATPEDVKNIIAYEEYSAQKNYHQRYLYYHANRDRAPLIQAGIVKSSDIITATELYATYENHQSEIDTFVANFPKTILEYDFPPRPYNANVKFFSRWETIVEAITKPGSKAQWLIFVANKDDGKFLYSKLDKISFFVNADKKGRIMEWIEQTAKFKQRVLITTSVLDNGVSIKSDNLRNVVIDSTDSVELRQMLGRKRLNDNEAINIYVHNKSSFDFESYCKSIEVKINAINSFEEDYGAFIEKQYDNCDYEVRKLFAYDRRYNMRFNNIYLLYCLGQKHSEYTKLQAALEDDANAFAKEVCSWLDVDFKDEMIMQEDDIFKEKWKKIEPIILSHSKPFDEKELNNIKDLLWSILQPNSRGTGMTFDDSRIKNSINKNLKIMAKNSCPCYYVKKRNNEYFFCKGEFDKASEEASDDTSNEESDE